MVDVEVDKNDLVLEEGVLEPKYYTEGVEDVALEVGYVSPDGNNIESKEADHLYLYVTKNINDEFTAKGESVDEYMVNEEGLLYQWAWSQLGVARSLKEQEIEREKKK